MDIVKSDGAFIRHLATSEDHAQGCFVGGPSPTTSSLRGASGTIAGVGPVTGTGPQLVV